MITKHLLFANIKSPESFQTLSIDPRAGTDRGFFLPIQHRQGHNILVGHQEAPTRPKKSTANSMAGERGRSSFKLCTVPTRY